MKVNQNNIISLFKEKLDTVVNDTIHCGSLNVKNPGAKGKFVDNLFYYSGQDNINHSSSDWPFLEIKDVGNPKMINLAKYTDTSKDTSIALINKIKWNLVLTFSEIENGILVFKKVIKLSELNIEEFKKYIKPRTRVTSKFKVVTQWWSSYDNLKQLYKKEEVIYDIS